jgi:Zinc carboxypeptidase
MPSPLATKLFVSRRFCLQQHRLAMGITLLALSACTSVPLPPWGAFPPAPATNLPPAQQQPESTPAPAPAAVEIRPVAPSVPAPLVAAPYSAAVTARFPAPAVVYTTPGLMAGRTSYSTQAEIHNWLSEQARVAARTSGVMAAVLPIGQSQRGEALEALVVTRAGGTDPAALLASGRPTVLLVGQQHGNEPAGSEALLVIAKEVSQGLLQPLLDRINVVIVPRANPDGTLLDQRVTSGGQDMNHDHLLLNTAEAQALAKLTRDYHPTVVVDAHEYTVTGRFLEKFGAIQKFDALVQYATTANLPEFLTKASEEWYRRPVLAALKAQGLTSEWYYTTSADPADKKISMGGVQPDTGRNVDGLGNTISLLIETRGVGIGRLHLQRRVHTHVTAISSVLGSTAQRAAELSQLRPYLEKEVVALACKGSAIVQALPTPAQYELLMLDPVSGSDRAISVDWDSALALRTVKARARPCGYWLSAASTTAVQRLRLHGVQVQRLTEAGSLLGDSYRETSRVVAEREDVRGPIANESIIKAEVSLARGVVDVPRGSFYVPLNQPLANIALAALEPDTQSSYFANRILEDLESTVRVMAPPNVRFEELP